MDHRATTQTNRRSTQDRPRTDPRPTPQIAPPSRPPRDRPPGSTPVGSTADRPLRPIPGSAASGSQEIDPESTAQIDPPERPEDDPGSTPHRPGSTPDTAAADKRSQRATMAATARTTRSTRRRASGGPARMTADATMATRCRLRWRRCDQTGPKTARTATTATAATARMARTISEVPVPCWHSPGTGAARCRDSTGAAPVRRQCKIGTI